MNMKNKTYSEYINKDKFYEAMQAAQDISTGEMGIGTLKERTLHRVIKYYFEPSDVWQEIRVKRFVADIKKEDQIIEVQTRDFAKLRKKLNYFLKDHKVKVVFPIAYLKWIAWINEDTGEISTKRKSPKKGTVYHTFFELYKIKDLLLHPNLSIHIMLINMDEYKLLNGWSYDKKRGAHRVERIPLELIDEMILKERKDYLKLIPDTLDEAFTAKDFKSHTALSLREAQTALNVLHHMHVIERIGKKGRAYLYKVHTDL